MSGKNLPLKNSIGSNQHASIKVAPSSGYELQETSTDPQQLNIGGTLSCSLYYNQGSVLDQLLWDVNISNASLTDTAEFQCLLNFLQYAELKINNQSVIKYESNEEVRTQIATFYEKYQDDKQVLHSKWRDFNGINATATAMQTTTVAPASTKNVKVSVLPLFYFLYDLPLQGINKLTFEFRTVASSLSASEANKIVKNQTANTNILPSLSLSSSKFVGFLSMFNGDLGVHQGKKTFLLKRHQVNKKLVDLSNLNAVVKYSLSNDFTYVKRMINLKYNLHDVANNSAYNSASALTSRDAFASLNVEWLVKGKSYRLLDSQSLRNYAKNETHHILYGGELGIDNYDSSYKNYFMGHDKLCFGATDAYQGCELLQGIANTAGTHEVEFTVVSGVSNNVEFNAIAEYYEILEIEPNGQVRVLV